MKNFAVYSIWGIIYSPTHQYLKISEMDGLKTSAIFSELKQFSFFQGLVSRHYEDRDSHIGVMRDPTGNSIIRYFTISENEVNFEMLYSELSERPVKCKLINEDGIWRGDFFGNNAYAGACAATITKIDES